MNERLITATVNLDGVERAFGRARTADLRPAFAMARKPLRDDQREHAKKQEGPDGSWAPRKSATRQRAQSRRNRRPRKLLGRLPGAIAVKAERDRVIGRSLVKWSGVHQDGGVAGRGARISARPFMWPSGAVVERVAGILADYVAKVIGR